MSIRPLEWVEAVDEVHMERIGDEDYVILFEEENDPLRIRHRITVHNFHRIFGPAFEKVDSVNEITPNHFDEVLGQNPDADYELFRKEVGYEDVIEKWKKKGVFSENNSGGSSY